MAIQHTTTSIITNEFYNSINESEDNQSPLVELSKKIIDTVGKIDAKTKDIADNVVKRKINPEPIIDQEESTEQIKKIKVLSREERETRICNSEKEVEDKLVKSLEFAQKNQNKIASNKEFLTEMKNQNFTEDYESSVKKEKVEDSDIEYIIGTNQGIRNKMEDTHIVTTITIKINSNTFKAPLLAVFDGHGGDSAALIIRKLLPQIIEEKIAEYNPETLTKLGLWNALKMAFVECGRKLSKEDSGTTATVAIVLEHEIWVANLGDSRTLFIKPHEWINKKESKEVEEINFKALEENEIIEKKEKILISMTEDQKPEDLRFLNAIKNRNGSIYKICGALRLEGVLNCARAFGDSCIKNGLTTRPKITAIPKEKGYLLLSSDGLFAPETINISNIDVAEGFCQNLHQGKDLLFIANNLIRSMWSLCMNSGSRTSVDNVTVLIYSIK